VLNHNVKKEIEINSGDFVIIPVILQIELKGINENVWQENKSYVKSLVFPLKIKRGNEGKYNNHYTELNLRSDYVDTLLSVW
jgi:hypothetical protein